MAVPTHEEKRQLLQNHYLLGKLSTAEIDGLLAFSRVERYPAGREIFAKGSPGPSMFAVLRGTVKITAPSSGGKEIVLNIIGAGEIFGEITLLDGLERSGDAVAMTACELLVLNRRDVMPVLEKRADICMMLLKILCERLRRTSEQVEDVLFRHLEGRIAKALLQLADSVGRRDARGVAIDLRVSQQELGTIVGGSRESVNKQLQIWQKLGLVALAKGSIVIRDSGALERLV
jgi:CRP/FNR family transcriptional regulator, cyclic AMP receptor protein